MSRADRAPIHGRIGWTANGAGTRSEAVSAGPQPRPSGERHHSTGTNSNRPRGIKRIPFESSLNVVCGNVMFAVCHETVTHRILWEGNVKKLIRTAVFMAAIGMHVPLWAAPPQPVTEAPAGFDTPTLVKAPGSMSVSNGIVEPGGDQFALDQQIYETQHDVTTGL